MATNTRLPHQPVPNGPMAASMLASGFGFAVLGLLTTLSAASNRINDSLNWYQPAGPVSGRLTLAALAFGAIWAILHIALRRKNINPTWGAVLAMGLLGLGILGTFPPFFDLFTRP